MIPSKNQKNAYVFKKTEFGYFHLMSYIVICLEERSGSKMHITVEEVPFSQKTLDFILEDYALQGYKLHFHMAETSEIKLGRLYKKEGLEFQYDLIDPEVLEKK